MVETGLVNLPNITSYPLPYSDITSSITKHLFTRWQHLWHNSTSNKLHNIYPTLPINSKYPKAHLTRQEQTLYNRVRIGHTYLTHSYLLKDEDRPICIPCNSLLTVEHMYSSAVLTLISFVRISIQLLISKISSITFILNV